MNAPLFPLTSNIWRSPLVSLALAATAGIIIDRHFIIPQAASLLVGLGFLLFWLVAWSRRQVLLALLHLWTAVAALAGAYHHWCREGLAGDDIGFFTTEEPQVVRLRGWLQSEPVASSAAAEDPLRTFQAEASCQFVLRATSIQGETDWRRVSGLALVRVGGLVGSWHAGDEIEVVGRLLRPEPAGNPGEFDYAAFLRDQGIRAQVLVKTGDGARRLQENWPGSATGWLAVVRGWGRGVLEATVPRHSGLATALLLGDSSALAQADWDKFVRTGVIHVLAISGQHLVVLAGFLWLGLRLLHVRRSHGAWAVVIILWAYALLAGGRPPVLRAAVMVLAGCGGMWLRRPVMTANTFALAWLLVLAVNPTDLAGTGCQLSFLAVAVLLWGLRRPDTEPDPLARLVAQSRPPWLRALLWLGRLIGWLYLVNAAVWLALWPLLAARNHLVSPIALVIGPPLVLLASLALVLGFLLLLLAPLLGPLAYGPGWLLDWILAGCDRLVRLGEQTFLAYFYVPDIPSWWLWVFYIALLLILTQETLRRSWKWWLPGGLAWMGVGMLGWFWPHPSGELRCTILAVGHGCCTVLETPDGRILLYDGGAMTGPEVTRRQIAPFLWQRRRRHIDEVFLSHADLDHFNGLPDLLERFSVGKVSCTPSFADRPSRAVSLTMQALQGQGIPVRMVKAGDQFNFGTVQVKVLHPPPLGPPESENARSLVLLISHGRHRMLLTGDLEGSGLAQMLREPPQPADVLLAPHHGSLAANTVELANWVQPRAVVSSQGLPKRAGSAASPYEALGARFFATWPHGAVTIRSSTSGLLLQTFRSRQHWMVRN